MRRREQVIDWETEFREADCKRKWETPVAEWSDKDVREVTYMEALERVAAVGKGIARPSCISATLYAATWSIPDWISNTSNAAYVWWYCVFAPSLALSTLYWFAAVWRIYQNWPKRKRGIILLTWFQAIALNSLLAQVVWSVKYCWLGFFWRLARPIFLNYAEWWMAIWGWHQN